MKHVDERKAFWTALLLFSTLLWTSGCTFDASGHAPVTRAWTCTVPVTECTYELLPTDTQVHSPLLQARISYTPFVVGEVGPYFDSGVVFQSIDTVPEAHMLNGALLVQTRQIDHQASGYSFSLEIDDKVTEVWLFYDERCEAPPSWITSDASYGGESGPSDLPYARVVLSGPGPGQDFDEHATFRGWKLNQPVHNLPAGQTAILDFYSNQGCSDPASTSNAMYFLAVVTAPDLNQTCLSTDTSTNEYIVEVPSSWVAWEAEEEALRACEASAEPYESCPDPSQGLVSCEASAENNTIVTQQFPLTTRHFAVSSEGEFTPNPASSPQLRITANGQYRHRERSLWCHLLRLRSSERRCRHPGDLARSRSDGGWRLRHQGPPHHLSRPHGDDLQGRQDPGRGALPRLRDREERRRLPHRRRREQQADALRVAELHGLRLLGGRQQPHLRLLGLPGLDQPGRQRQDDPAEHRSGPEG